MKSEKGSVRAWIVMLARSKRVGRSTRRPVAGSREAMVQEPLVRLARA